MLVSGLIACLTRGLWKWCSMKGRHQLSEDPEDGSLTLFFFSSIQGKTGEPGLPGAEGARGPPVSAGPMLSLGKYARILSYRSLLQHSAACITNSAFSVVKLLFPDLSHLMPVWFSAFFIISLFQLPCSLL